MLKFEVIPDRKLGAVIQKMAEYDRIASNRLKGAMDDSTMKIEAQAMRNSPVGVTSRLRGSIGSEVKDLGSAIVGRVGSSLRGEVYPKVQEVGRKFGRKQPPPGALDRWVQIKLGVPRKQVRSVAYLIGRKLKRRGMVGKFYLRKAYFTSKPYIERRFRLAVQRIKTDLKNV